MSAVTVATLLVSSTAMVSAWAQSATVPQDDTSVRLDRRTSLGTPGATTDDQQNADAADENADIPDPNDPSTATIGPDGERLTDEEIDAAALKELRRQNIREEGVDGLKPAIPDNIDLTPGIRLGSFIFRPAISEGVGVERQRTGKDSLNRTYMQTGFKGSLVSDWSLHELRIDSEGTWQKTLSGIPEDDPEGKIEAQLKLDLSDATKANLRLGYSMQREDISAANAVANASNQALVSTYTANAEVTHDLGLIRGTAGLDFERNTYGDAQLQNGKFVSQADRNANTATMRGRLGYELSAALIPFIEASYGRTLYDNHKDALGYVRDANIYAVKTGIETDFGEKLRGELSAGYAVAKFDDSRLDEISAFTLDGKANWSPQRGTDVELGLKTEIEPSTSAGASGDVAYTANAALTQAIIDSLTGRIDVASTLRDYSLAATSNQYVVNVGGGLTWGLSRSIDLNADVSWEKTTQSGVPTSDVFTAMIGLSLKR